MIAPATAEARISAPVFFACMTRSASAFDRRRAWIGAQRGRAPGRRPCPSRRRRRRRRRDAQLAGDNRRVGCLPACAPAARTPPSAVHRLQESPCLRRRRHEASAGRGAACRCPWPADRRESANRCESARSRTRRASPATGRRRRLRRRQAENRTQPLSAGRDAVAHRIGHDERAVRGRRKRGGQGGLDFSAAGLQVLAERRIHAPGLRTYLSLFEFHVLTLA